MPKQNLSKKQMEMARGLFEHSSEELHDLVEFFIDTGCETARDSGNLSDGGMIRIFARVFCPDQSGAVEGKLAGEIVTR